VGAVLADLDPGNPKHAAFVEEAAELMRGASYAAFDGAPPAEPAHGAVAAPYAHVTAPLRRLADRYATEVCLALHAGTAVPDWARTALPRLPEVMQRTDQTANAAERGAIDLVEALLLRDRVGEVFDATVLEVDPTTVALDDPPVRARCVDNGVELGARVRVRLVESDPDRRKVRFGLA
jgi:exoribonuclease R